MTTPKNTDRDSVESTTLFDAVARLRGLADRWDETPEWHNPPFLDGRIHITTGDLRDIATVLREIRPSNDQTDSGANGDCRPVHCSAVVGDFYGGLEWFACWLIDHVEGETITEELLRPWAYEAWKAHLVRPDAIRMAPSEKP